MTSQEIKRRKEHIAARNRKYAGFGRMASAAEWARLLGLPRNTTWRYLKQGFTPEEIAEIRDIKKLKE